MLLFSHSYEGIRFTLVPKQTLKDDHKRPKSPTALLSAP
jgi:hypothetical protein